MQMTDLLLSPYQLNNTITLKNRIVMAPMTRNMATEDLSPTEAMAQYYARRADTGLIITEGTIIRPDAKGYSNAPGIFTDAHINAWRKTTEAVHASNGIIFQQIWHVGRVSHPEFLNGELPVAPSATMMKERVKRAQGLNYGQSRAVTAEEIKQLIASYATAAKNAVAAGFDGIEIHGANGYLIDQFLHYDTNHRTDEYGATPANMARFALEVVLACGNAIGFERVGIRLSPVGYLNEIGRDNRDASIFEYLLVQLNQLSIAYVHVGNNDDSNVFAELNNLSMTQFMRHHYQGTLIACGNYNFANARAGILADEFDLVAIGRPFIANPDLIARLQNKQVLQRYEINMLNNLY